ncbi:hypothetical protein [Sphingopyxis panaciterrae]|uniref:hypothetical protein n=1 Tax=Sphingopyxis panaciterrae TaxID=363841 RepID=UPI00141EAC18|nr:hypothetical protein [Sphingopyxis panaciterrae]
MPTLAILGAFLAKGRQAGLGEENMEKLEKVASCAADSVRLLRRSGIPIGFGTDLFGKTHGNELTEFGLRKGLETPIDVLRSATSVNAPILGKSGELGCIAKGPSPT